MLLHVIQPPQRIDAAVNRVADLWNRSLDDVQNAISLSVDAIDNARLAQHSRVVWLPAAGRIERRAIECHGNCAVISFADVDYPRVKFQQVRIAIVESFSCAH